MPSDSSVTYEELDAGLPEGQNTGRFSATRQLKCAWGDRHQLMNDLLALPGALYPWKTPTLARARQAGSKGIGKMLYDPVTGPSYQYAQVSVQYETPQIGVTPEQVGGAGGPVITESLEPWAEFLTLDYNDFRWGSPNGDELHPDEAPGRLDRGLEYVYKRYGVQAIPNAATALVGYVNDSTVIANTLGLSFAAETLLFSAPTLERNINIGGYGLWTLVYRFTFRPQGWNKFWRAKTSSYEYMYIAEGSTDPYRNHPTGDFTDL